MSQLRLYLPDGLADQVKRRAQSRGLSVSAYLAAVVKSQLADQWPAGFFEEVVGGWVDEPLQGPEQPPFEERETIDVPSRHERVHQDFE